MEEGYIQSPEGAIFFVEQNLFDASDPSSCLAISIHETEKGPVGNVWSRQFGQWIKELPEKVYLDKTNQIMLSGELLRFSMKNSVRIFNDPRLFYGVMGLSLAISAKP